jgi:hypothetical protein
VSAARFPLGGRRDIIVREVGRRRCLGLGTHIFALRRVSCSCCSVFAWFGACGFSVIYGLCTTCVVLRYVYLSRRRCAVIVYLSLFLFPGQRLPITASLIVKRLAAVGKYTEQPNLYCEGKTHKGTRVGLSDVAHDCAYHMLGRAGRKK